MKMLLNTKDQKKLLKKFKSKDLELQRDSFGKKSLKIALLELISKHLFLSVELIEKFTEVHLVKYFNLKILKKIIEKNNF